jgi:hypothetical protein
MTLFSYSSIIDHRKRFPPISDMLNCKSGFTLHSAPKNLLLAAGRLHGEPNCMLLSRLDLIHTMLILLID